MSRINARINSTILLCCINRLSQKEKPNQTKQKTNKQKTNNISITNNNKTNKKTQHTKPPQKHNQHTNKTKNLPKPNQTVPKAHTHTHDPVVYLFCFICECFQKYQSKKTGCCHNNQLSSRGLLLSPTAWSPHQHLLAMIADVSRYTLGRNEGRGLGFGQLVRTHTGKCLKCQSSSEGHSDHSALCVGGK